MKFTELANKTIPELYQQAAGLKKQMMTLRIKAAQPGGVEDTSLFKKCRRDLARIKTKITQLKSL